MVGSKATCFAALHEAVVATTGSQAVRTQLLPPSQGITNQLVVETLFLLYLIKLPHIT